MADKNNDDAEYEYCVLTSDKDARECAQMLAQSFAQMESFTRFRASTVEEYYVRKVLPRVLVLLNEHLSFFARQRTTGEIVGCVLAGDLYLDRLRFDPKKSGRHPFDDLINELDEILLQTLTEELRPDVHLRISHTGTKADFTGKGICSRLTRYVCEHAKNTRGFKYVHVNVTSPVTRHIYLTKMNGKIITETDTISWVWNKDDGICPFQDCQNESIANIMVDMDNCLFFSNQTGQTINNLEYFLLQ